MYNSAGICVADAAVLIQQLDTPILMRRRMFTYLVQTDKLSIPADAVEPC